MPIDEQGTNVTVGTVDRLKAIDEQAICLMTYM